MSKNPAVLTSKPEWQALKEHRERLDGIPMTDLFGRDPERARRYFIEAAGLSLDFSKNRLTDEVLEALEKTSQEAVEDLVAGNDQARRIYESYRDFRDSVMPYIAVAEQSALNVRSTVLGQKAP